MEKEGRTQLRWAPRPRLRPALRPPGWGAAGGGGGSDFSLAALCRPADATRQPACASVSVRSIMNHCRQKSTVYYIRRHRGGWRDSQLQRPSAPVPSLADAEAREYGAQYILADVSSGHEAQRERRFTQLNRPEINREILPDRLF